jgi:putative endonuclease
MTLTDKERFMDERSSYVYILANRLNGTLYPDVTSNLPKRIYEHKNKFVDGFIKKYFVDRLVYYEIHSDIREAILREKQIKKWRRSWKMKLIFSQNPNWEDLYESLGVP